jgi:hypothetical protein
MKAALAVIAATFKTANIFRSAPKDFVLGVKHKDLQRMTKYPKAGNAPSEVMANCVRV